VDTPQRKGPTMALVGRCVGPGFSTPKPIMVNAANKFRNCKYFTC
jgi:hypothetical protein